MVFLAVVTLSWIVSSFVGMSKLKLQIWLNFVAKTCCINPWQFSVWESSCSRSPLAWEEVCAFWKGSKVFEFPGSSCNKSIKSKPFSTSEAGGWQMHVMTRIEGQCTETTKQNKAVYSHLIIADLCFSLGCCTCKPTGWPTGGVVVWVTSILQYRWDAFPVSVRTCPTAGCFFIFSKQMSFTSAATLA